MRYFFWRVYVHDVHDIVRHFGSHKTVVNRTINFVTVK